MRRDRVRGGLAQLHDDSTAAIGDDGGGNDDDDDDDYVERAKCSRGERKESRDLESVRSFVRRRGRRPAGCREQKFSSR